MLKNYLKIALRNLLKHKGYSFINVAGLAFGMTCCLLLCLYVQDELSFDAYHEKADRIYRLVIDYESNAQVFPNALSSAPMGPQLSQDFPDVEEFVRFCPSFNDVLVSHGDKSFFESGLFYADPSVFAVFSFPLLSGDPGTALADAFSVVVTEEIAQKYFNGEDPLGQVLLVNNKDEYKITGVVKDLPANSHFRFDFLASFQTLESLEFSRGLRSWTHNPFYTYILLPKDYRVGPLEEQLPQWAHSHAGDILDRMGWKWRPWLQPLTDIHLHPLTNELQSGSSMKYIYIFSAIAIFVLLIACINFMNLATARSATRAKEVGLRKVIGANRFQLVKQFLGESIILSLISLVLAILLAEMLLPFFNALIGRQLDIDYWANWGPLAGVLVVAFCVGIAAGSYPAFFLSAFQPSSVLKGAVKVGSRNFTLRRALVVLQFTISIILIISTVVVIDQLVFMKNKNLGLNGEQVVVIPVRDQSILENHQGVKARLMNNPGVLSVTLANRPPGTGAAGTSVRRQADSPDDLQSMKYLLIEHDFLRTLEIDLIAGRDFSTEFATDATEAFIINEQAAQDLGWNDPLEAIGQPIVWAGDLTGTVIGVTENFHFQPLRIFMQPLVLKIYPDRFQYLLVRISPTYIPGSLEFLQQTWAQLAPGWPFVYSFLDEDFNQLYQVEERFGKIFGNFTFLAILIASLGLFGLASFSAEQRTKEIGIRKTLGATAPGIVGLLSKEFTVLVALANVIAWPIAYYFMQKWLQGFAFRIELVQHLWTFGLSGLLALVLALLTVSYQSIRASFVNPIEALRYE